MVSKITIKKISVLQIKSKIIKIKETSKGTFTKSKNNEILKLHWVSFSNCGFDSLFKLLEPAHSVIWLVMCVRTHTRFWSQRTQTSVCIRVCGLNTAHL